MAKKTTAALLIAAALLFTACSSQPSSGQNSQSNPQAPQLSESEQLANIAAAPFTMDYGYSEGQIKSLTENDTLDTAADGGPLYNGNADYEQPGLKKFQELKAALVGEITTETDALNQDAKAYATDLKALKEKYIGYLGDVLQQNNKLLRQIKEVTKDIIGTEVKYVANFATFDSIVPTTKNRAVAALLQYQKVYLALQDTSLLTDDTARTVGGLLTLQNALQVSTDQSMQKIAQGMDAEVSSSVDALGTKLAALQEKSGQINSMLRQIDSAEYLMGMSSVQYVEENLAKLQPTVDALAPGGTFTKEDVEFTRDLVKHFGEMNAQIKQQLALVEKNVSSKVPANTGGSEQTTGPVTMIPTARAEEEKSYASRAFDALKGLGKATVEAGKTVGTLGWQAAKSTFNAGRTMTGVTLDTLGAGTKSGFDVIYGVANGNSAGEIASEIGGNFKKVATNLKEGKSGSETLKTATGYFDGAEEAAGSAASSAVEGIVGKGWTSWAAGHAGKLTANLFTSLGKGITKVANLQSTNGEIAEGALDIGMSFIGGSKVIASSSQLARGSKEALKVFGEKGINFLGKMLNSGDIKAIKGLTAEILTSTKLTASQVSQLLSNELSIEIKEGLQEELKQIGKNLNQKFIQLLKGGGSTVLENATTGAKEAYIEFVHKSFENTLKGFGESLVTVLGEDFTKYVDNILANAADDVMKDAIKNYIDKGKIPGVVDFPDLKNLAGKWDQGEMVVTDVIASEEFKKNAEKEGCNLADIEKQKGKKQNLGITLQPTGDKGGNMILQMSDGKPQTIPFTYEDGQIKATLSQDGGTVNMGLSVTENNGKYEFSGPMDINFSNGGLKITATAGGTKTANDSSEPQAPATPSVPAGANDVVKPGQAPA